MAAVTPGLGAPDSGTGAGTELPRVVVIDDHALFRQGVIAAIQDNVDVVGEADDIESGVEVTLAQIPDVVLLDVHLTSGSGAEVIAQVNAVSPEIRFLALSVSDSPADVLSVVRVGARGYVTKRIGGEDLVMAIRQVANGSAVFSPHLAGFVLGAFSAASPDPSASANAKSDSDVDRLSPREHEVMQYLARGYAYKEIASELHISVRTVESHASAVLRKLQLSNRNELAHWANKNDLL